jgi:2-dehydro-3-deoxyphosphooctonate aldolase (KDO 8-P synthase)
MFVFAGPCVIESRDVCFTVAERLREITESTGIGIVFKASFDKANRTSIHSYRGPGLEAGLRVLEEVRQETGLALVTDVHLPEQASAAGEVVDCVQIPAFLCRQTDLLVAAAESGAVVNVKKGQFLSPWEMKNVVNKLVEAGSRGIMLCERGTFFGYNRLVNDMGAIMDMQEFGYPVIFDATHSTQQPGGLGSQSAGAREKAPVLAKAAIAAGANGLFFEVHPEPDEALCDAACMMRLDDLEDTLIQCKRIFNIIRGRGE